MSMFQPTAEQLQEHSGPTTKIVARPDLLLSTRDVPEDPWSTEVYWARWGEAEVEQRITELLDRFARAVRVSCGASPIRARPHP
jgi:hypothetical protein